MNAEAERQALSDAVEEMGYEDVIIFDGYYTAAIGISDDGRAVYDYGKMIDWLVNRDHMTEDEAVEWIEFNTIRALPYAGGKAPIVMYRIGED